MILFVGNAYAGFIDDRWEISHAVIERIKFVFVYIACSDFFQHIAEIRFSVFYTFYLQIIFARFRDGGIIAGNKVVHPVRTYDVFFYLLTVCPKVIGIELRIGRPSYNVNAFDAEYGTLKITERLARFGLGTFKIKRFAACVTFGFYRYNVIAGRRDVEIPVPVRYPFAVVYFLQIRACVLVALPNESYGVRFGIRFDDGFRRRTEFNGGKSKFAVLFLHRADVRFYRNGILPRFLHFAEQVELVFGYGLGGIGNRNFILLRVLYRFPRKNAFRIKR